MKYTILLKQHIGAPCIPCVAVGNSIIRGQLIATPNGLGAPIHSPFSGTICDSTETTLQIDAAKHQPEDILPLTGDTPASLLEQSGIVGMGGAGFPTHIKCSTDLKGGYILVNGAECEPLLHHNMKQLEDQTELMIEGLRIVMKLCNASKGIIAIKSKNKKAIEALNIYCNENISYHLLPDLYPMGEERAIVREVLGKLLAPTELPSVANAVVINVETLLRVAEAVQYKRPCITKDITVAGKLKGGTHSRVFKDVPIGTTVGQLLEQAGGIDGEYGEIIMGGPFTGRSVFFDSPITKTTGGIIVTNPFQNLKKAKTGLLLCACGGNEERMREIASKMNGDVVSIQQCKQAVDVKGTLKCENPGNCPGQAQKCLNFKKADCTHIIIGNCSDCTNTVMGSAPKLGLEIHHQTDHVMETVGMEKMRYLTKSKKVESVESSEPIASYQIEQSISDGILRIDIKEGKNIHIELPF
jgi:proline reductase-associated electron transfer protein PrdC